METRTSSGNIGLCKYVVGAGTSTWYTIPGVELFNFYYDGISHMYISGRLLVDPRDYRILKVSINDGSVPWNNRIPCPVAQWGIVDTELTLNSDKSIFYVFSGVLETTNKCLFLAFSASTGAVHGNRFMSSVGWDFSQDIEFKNNKLYLTFKYNTDYVLAQFDPVTHTFVSFYKNANKLTRFIEGQSGDR